MHITRNEFKIFASLFVKNFKNSKSSMSGLSSSHGGVRSANYKNLDAEVFSEYNFKNKNLLQKKVFEDDVKPRSEKQARSREKIGIKVANYHSGPFSCIPKAGPGGSSSSKKPKLTCIDQATCTEELMMSQKKGTMSNLEKPGANSSPQIDNGHLNLDIRDLCRASRGSFNAAKNSQAENDFEVRNLYDDANDLSVDSNDAKYILENDFEDSSYQAIEVERSSRSNSELPHKKISNSNKNGKLDLENLRLKFDYEDEVRISEEKGCKEAPPPSPEPKAMPNKPDGLQRSYVNMIKKINIQFEEQRVRAKEERTQHLRLSAESSRY
jgi:hypothetical protein